MKLIIYYNYFSEVRKKKGTGTLKLSP